MDYSFPSLRDTFMDTKKERRAFHRGIYKGLLVYWNPYTMYKREALQFSSFKVWERNEQQYEDTTMSLFFFLKYLGLYAVYTLARPLGVELPSPGRFANLNG